MAAEVFSVGLRIGKYELTRKLAEGGFGVLFVALDRELDRELVIKFLLPQHASNADVVQRFLQEGRSLARVVHPGIVTVYESGEVQGTGTLADGAAYLIMELLIGETLSQRIQRSGRLSVAAAMELCRQIANALQAAHDQGIVHRDLKPDNIMLIKDPSLSLGDRAKVLDFGIAKLATAGGAASHQTQQGMVFGTPIYMSPEQAKSTASTTASSDIYSLGCILFELLVGRPPFEGSMAELIAAHILTPPPVPSEVAPGIPPHIDHVIAAMMAKQPAERPGSMKVVETILEEKRVVASMARRRTLGGAKLATMPPPMSAQAPSQAASPATSPVSAAPIARGASPTPAPGMPHPSHGGPPAAAWAPVVPSTPTTLSSATGVAAQIEATARRGSKKKWIGGLVAVGALAAIVVVAVVASGGGERTGATPAVQGEPTAPPGTPTPSPTLAIPTTTPPPIPTQPAATTTVTATPTTTTTTTPATTTTTTTPTTVSPSTTTTAIPTANPTTTTTTTTTTTPTSSITAPTAVTKPATPPPSPTTKPATPTSPTTKPPTTTTKPATTTTTKPPTTTTPTTKPPTTKPPTTKPPTTTPTPAGQGSAGKKCQGPSCILDGSF